jgi:hypothetical protein
VTLPEGSTVPARRSRAALAVVVAEWTIGWREEGDSSEGPPEWLFRPDEIADAESLEAGELMIAAACLAEAIDIHKIRAGQPKVRHLRVFADAMYSHAARWYARRYGPSCRPRRTKPRSLGRRRVRSRRCQSRAPPGGDGSDDDPDAVDDRARRGWSR